MSAYHGFKGNVKTAGHASRNMARWVESTEARNIENATLFQVTLKIHPSL